MHETTTKKPRFVAEFGCSGGGLYVDRSPREPDRASCCPIHDPSRAEPCTGIRLENRKPQRLCALHPSETSVFVFLVQGMRRCHGNGTSEHQTTRPKCSCARFLCRSRVGCLRPRSMTPSIACVCSYMSMPKSDPEVRSTVSENSRAHTHKSYVRMRPSFFQLGLQTRLIIVCVFLAMLWLAVGWALT